MSVKFLICLTIINFGFYFNLLSAQTEYPPKDQIFVNGFEVENYGKKELIGLRSKALADLEYRKEQFSEAIKYYEEASKYIPNEADIYMNLGNIYAHEKVFRMAVKYYKIAIDKYLLPENHGKTQLYSYLSQVRYAYYLAVLGKFEDNQKRAEGILQKLLRVQNEIQENYPEIIPELDRLRRQVYGDVTIIKVKPLK